MEPAVGSSLAAGARDSCACERGGCGAAGPRSQPAAQRAGPLSPARTVGFGDSVLGGGSCQVAVTARVCFEQLYCSIGDTPQNLPALEL